MRSAHCRSVSQDVTLPGGTYQSVLVPKLHLAQSGTVDLTSSGAIVTGNAVNLSGSPHYTVRGFDGETMLAAEKGFYWRNELQMPIGQTGQALYVGIDYGRVFGPNTAFLAGTQLAGAVTGIRGSMPARLARLSYDLFAGTPIYKPSDFSTARVTLGFQTTAQF